MCLIFAIVYGQLEQEKDSSASDLEGAESANPQWGGYGGYGRGKSILHHFLLQKNQIY